MRRGNDFASTRSGDERMKPQKSVEDLFSEALDAEREAKDLQGAARQAKLKKAERLLNEALAQAAA